MVNFGVQWLLPHFWAKSWVHGDGNGAIADGNTTVYPWQPALALAPSQVCRIGHGFVGKTPKKAFQITPQSTRDLKSRKNYRAKNPGAPENALWEEGISGSPTENGQDGLPGGRGTSERPRDLKTLEIHFSNVQEPSKNHQKPIVDWF